MKNMNMKFLGLAALMVLSGCSFESRDPEFPTKKVLFTYQQYNRQLVVGEGLGMKVGFVFSGLIENDRPRTVKFVIDPSLVTNPKQSVLPEDYYTFDNPSEIVIPKGELKTYMPVRIDSAKFVNDPRSLTGEYILPIRITEADADEIAGGKETTMISLSYFGKQHGNYRYEGKAVNTATGEVQEYKNLFTNTNSIRQLQTVGVNKFRVYADQAGQNDWNKGRVSMIITVPVKGGGKVSIEPDTEYLPEVIVYPDGESVYDEATKAFTLRYRYTIDGTEWKAEDILTFRNRVRDDQGDGRVLYEWRGF